MAIQTTRRWPSCPVVSRIDIGAARQAHFLRKAIELEVVRSLAAQADPVLVAQLTARIDL